MWPRLISLIGYLWAMAILYSASFLRIQHHERAAVMESEWLDFAQGERLRTAMLEMVRLGQIVKAHGWIDNQELMRTIRPCDQEWIMDTFMAEFTRLPLRRLAVVRSRDALNRMGMKNILQQRGHLFPWETQSFDKRAEAFQWVAAGTSIPERIL